MSAISTCITARRQALSTVTTEYVYLRLENWQQAAEWTKTYARTENRYLRLLLILPVYRERPNGPVNIHAFVELPDERPSST
jgi:hypothetical protein